MAGQVWHAHPPDGGGAGDGSAGDPFNGWPTTAQWGDIQAGDVLDLGGHRYTGRGNYDVEKSVTVQHGVLDIGSLDGVWGVRFQTSVGAGVPRVTLRYLSILNVGDPSGVTTKAVRTYLGSITETADNYCRFLNCLIEGGRGPWSAVTPGATSEGAICIDHRGSGLLVQGCWLRRAAVDLIYAEGKNIAIVGNVLEYPSMDRPTGDCVQINDYADNLLIERNWMLHTNQNKQGILVSNQVDGGASVIRNNVLVYQGDAPILGQSGIRAGNSRIYGNHLIGFYDGILLASDGLAYANVVERCVRHGIAAMGASTGVKMYNNLVLDCVNGVWFDATDASEAKNNLLVNCSGFGMQLEDAANVRSHNAYSNCGVAVALDNVTQSLGTGELEQPIEIDLARASRPITIVHDTGGVEVLMPRWMVPTYEVPEVLKRAGAPAAGMVDQYGRFMHRSAPEIGPMQRAWAPSARSVVGRNMGSG